MTKARGKSGKWAKKLSTSEMQHLDWIMFWVTKSGWFCTTYGVKWSCVSCLSNQSVSFLQVLFSALMSTTIFDWWTMPLWRKMRWGVVNSKKRMEKIRNVWFMWPKDNLYTKKLVGVISAAAPAPFIIWDYIFCLPILIKRHLLIWLWNLWGKEEHCASSLKEHYVDLLRDFLCNLEPCTVSVWNITV